MKPATRRPRTSSTVARKLRPGIRVDEFLDIEDSDDPGTYETRWGRAWLQVKINDPTKPYMLANELIGARLAAALGLPTLPGEIARDFDGKDCWVTPRISETGTTSPPPATEQQIAADHPTVVAGMLAFDSWIHNVDRTADNVLFDPRLGVWLIDHENSLAEPDGRAFSRKAEQAAETPLASHPFAAMPLDPDGVRFWAARIAIISRHVIERPLDEANRRGLITKPEMAWMLKYLMARRTMISRLIPTLGDVTNPAPIVGPCDEDERTLF